jgi:hypothetical protein
VALDRVVRTKLWVRRPDEAAMIAMYRILQVLDDVVPVESPRADDGGEASDEEAPRGDAAGRAARPSRERERTTAALLAFRKEYADPWPTPAVRFEGTSVGVDEESTADRPSAARPGARGVDPRRKR